ncbi:MAG: Cof-type HAD-IIB family hydrolase [Sulfobacillus sp.]|nr:Cof-type HAD-IIB family hydrolase [Sulfobacillus sp.]
MDHLPRIALIALDLDGTSVGPDGQLTPRLVAAVEKARAAGVRVILATGRMVQSAAPYWQALSLEPGPLVAYNGGVVAWMPEGEVRFKRTLPDTGARLMVNRALAAELLVQVYIGQELWVSREDARVRRYVEQHHIAAWVRNGEELLDWPEPPIKLLLQGEPDVLDGFRHLVQSEAEQHGIRVFKSQRDYLEMVPEGVGKGPALKVAADLLGIPQAQVMAIGDAENDVDMIRWAGLGVAMGQAPESVQSAADWVTLPLTEEGAAVAIERWVLEGVRPLNQGG